VGGIEPKRRKTGYPIRQKEKKRETEKGQETKFSPHETAKKKVTGNEWKKGGGQCKKIAINR